MNESELIFQYSEDVGSIWSLMQWWVSISFGVIAVAHFSAERLSRLLAAMLVILYIVFSIAMFGGYRSLALQTEGIASALIRLDSDGLLTEPGMAILMARDEWLGRPFGSLAIAASSLLFFVGTIGFVIHTSMKAGRASN